MPFAQKYRPAFVRCLLVAVAMVSVMPAHIKSALVGSSVSILITNHVLNLGIWQGSYLCEFRNRGGYGVG